MSHPNNDALLERASSLLEEIVSHPSGLDKKLLVAMERGDLEELERTVNDIEGLLAQEHFFNYDLIIY